MEGVGSTVGRATGCSLGEEPEQLVDGLERRRVVDEARDVANEAEATFFDDFRGNRRVQLVQFGIRDVRTSGSRALFGVAYYGHLEGATGPLWS